MLITSFNVTDVAYHYIGLRAINAGVGATREQQEATISRSVLKYARDKAMRLMLPEPRGTFETTGRKVSQELVHLGLAEAKRGAGFNLTDAGRQAVGWLQTKEHKALRRDMVHRHLDTYTNLRDVVRWHVNNSGGLLMPIVDTARWSDRSYLRAQLEPMLGASAGEHLELALASLRVASLDTTDNMLRGLVLEQVFGVSPKKVAVYRALFDRMVSLRLLNTARVRRGSGEFVKSYTPCVHSNHPDDWTTPIRVGDSFVLNYCDPDMQRPEVQRLFAAALNEAFENLPAQAGYYDLPEVRDFVCERLLIPEAAFDEGTNAMLDSRPPRLTVGLTYERISGRRKPLVRTGESTQIFNLLRSA